MSCFGVVVRATWKCREVNDEYEQGEFFSSCRKDLCCVMLFSWCRPGSVLKQEEGKIRMVLNWDRCAECILAWVENRMSQMIASFMRRLLWCIVLMITQILDSLYGTAQLVLFMLRDFVRIVTTLHCKCSINTEVVVAWFLELLQFWSVL